MRPYRRKITKYRDGRIFEDKVQVHTSAWGTQYVHPIDIFFSEEEEKQWIDEARAKARMKVRA